MFEHKMKDPTAGCPVLILFFFLAFFFLMWTMCKVFIEFVTTLLPFFDILVFQPQGIWDLSSQTRDQTCTPCVGRQSFNHWTTREVPHPNS